MSDDEGSRDAEERDRRKKQEEECSVLVRCSDFITSIVRVCLLIEVWLSQEEPVKG